MGRYDPLRGFLLNCGKEEVVLSFEDIETILRHRLPNSAFYYDAWWGNVGDCPKAHHRQAKAWREAGFRAKVDRKKKMVCFCRDQIGV